MTTSQTRRKTLQLAAAAAASAGLAGVTTAQETENGNDAEDDAENGTETDRLPIILGARAEYWYGIAPTEIEGEENPTLEFAAGESYELVWINLDGVEHNLILESEDGEELESSEETETAGETVSMTVEASDETSEYYCEYHPDSMRGDVELNGGFDLSRDDDHDHTDGNQTDDDTGGDDHTDGDGDEGC